MTNKEITSELTSIDDLFTIIKYMIAPTDFRIEPVRTMFGTDEPNYVRDIAGIKIEGRRHEINIYGGTSLNDSVNAQTRTEILKRICDEVGECTQYVDYSRALRSFIDIGSPNTKYCKVLCVDDAYDPFSSELGHRLLHYAPLDNVVVYSSMNRLNVHFDVCLDLFKSLIV